jgi:hypothetical protein
MLRLSAGRKKITFDLSPPEPLYTFTYPKLG